MRNIFDMAMLVSDSDRPSPKVWQPWYIDESDGIRKTLPTRVSREQRARERMALHKPLRRTLSPSPPINEEIDVGGTHPHPAHVGAYSYAYIEDTFDDDAPLDMSIKRRTPPPTHTPILPLPPPPAHTPTHSHTPPPLQPLPAHITTVSSPPPYSSWAARGRPTVITCAAPWYLPSSAHAALPPPPSYDVAAAHLREHRRAALRAEEGTHTPPTTPTVTAEGGRSSPESGSDVEASRRHVVQAGPVDPEIDEHFRRSLGRNYQELFVSDPPSDQQHDSNDSVDDHFTKALGATWTKLKAEREKGASVSLSLSRVSPPPAGTPSPTVTPLALPRGTPGVPARSRSFSPTSHSLRTVVTPAYVVATSTNAATTLATISNRRAENDEFGSKFISTET